MPNIPLRKTPHKTRSILLRIEADLLDILDRFIDHSYTHNRTELINRILSNWVNSREAIAKEIKRAQDRARKEKRT